MDCECRPEYVRDDFTGNCVCPTGLEFDDNLQCVPVQPICEGLMEPDGANGCKCRSDLREIIGNIPAGRLGFENVQKNRNFLFLLLDLGVYLLRYPGTC